MSISTLKSRMLAGDKLAGTFIKTPSYEVVEVLARSGLDFLCFDGEHSPFDRGRMDACIGMARALDLPPLVRVSAGDPDKILLALDSGAVGVVVPHVDSREKAQAIAKSAHFGNGGRGYAGSTRWAGFATRTMSEVLAQDAETIVIAQIEEPEAVAVAGEIASVDGIDGLFAGPADLSVCFGVTDQTSDIVRGAMRDTATAARDNGKAFMTFAAHSDQCAELAELGANMFFVASEHSFMIAEAKRTANAIHEL